jgi:hypothetical protein
MQNPMISILVQPFPRQETLILIPIGQRLMDFTSMETITQHRTSN